MANVLIIQHHAHLAGAVKLDYRAVITEPLTRYEDGGIDPKKIAPKARVY